MDYAKIASDIKQAMDQDWGVLTDEATDPGLWFRDKVKSFIPPYITPVAQDYKQILLEAAKIMDGVAWSQLYLASPLSILPPYDRVAMGKELKRLQDKFKDSEVSPFLKGAKMRTASAEMSPDDQDWNDALALTAALKVMEKNATYTKYKIYPKGSTPAFTDSAGVTRISSSLNHYIVGSYSNIRVVFASSPDLERPTFTFVQGGVSVEGYPGVLFVSKSGDWENLITHLALRDRMRLEFLAAKGNVFIIPRFGSISLFEFPA